MLLVDNMISFFDDNYNVRRINILNNVIIIYDVVLNYIVEIFEGDMGAIQPASLHTPILSGVYPFFDSQRASHPDE